MNGVTGDVAQDVFWGAYNPSHEYSFDVIGIGETIGFVISDPWQLNNRDVFDNSGVLNVTITAIPEPSTIAVWSLLGFIVLGGSAWRRRRKQAA